MVSLASISDYLNVWKYESSNLEPVSSFRSTTGHCSCLAWNHTNQVVATGGNNHQIHLIQANNGNILSSLQVSEDLDVNSKTNAIALSSNSRFLAAAISNKIQLWDLKRRQLKTTLLGHQADVTSLCFLPTGEAISGDIGGTIRIWDSKAYIPSPAMTMTSGTLSVAGVTSLSISPTGGSALAAGYNDGVLGIWDSATYQLLRRQVFHSGSLNALAFSPRNPRLVTTAGSDGKVTLIDTGAKNSTDPSALIDLSGVSATTVTFHEDAIHTAIGLSNGKILIYDWRNLRKPVVATSERAAYPILALSFQVNGRDTLLRSVVSD
jgi:WD40 repeat protein